MSVIALSIIIPVSQQSRQNTGSHSPSVCCGRDYIDTMRTKTCARYFDDALTTLELADFAHPFEIIEVDDGSTDQTGSIVDDYERPVPFSSSISPHNQ
jgi:hypothetical protein